VLVLLLVLRGRGLLLLGEGVEGGLLLLGRGLRVRGQLERQ
jgi:hypothetical protein